MTFGRIQRMNMTLKLSANSISKYQEHHQDFPTWLSKQKKHTHTQETNATHQARTTCIFSRRTFLEEMYKVISCYLSQSFVLPLLHCFANILASQASRNSPQKSCSLTIYIYQAKNMCFNVLHVYAYVSSMNMCGRHTPNVVWESQLIFQWQCSKIISKLNSLAHPDINWKS